MPTRGPTDAADKFLTTRAEEQLTTISERLLRRETIEREEFEALLRGRSEEEVFHVTALPDRIAA